MTAKISDILDHETVTVEMLWHHFAVSTLPKHVSRIQHDEMKHAYYAGFLSCFEVMSSFSNDLDEDAACRMFSRLEAESQVFFKEIIERRNNRASGPSRYTGPGDDIVLY